MSDISSTTERHRSPETAWEKTVRKFTAEPLVPLGTLLTTACLIYGLKAYHNGNQVTAQKLMRGRVLAQGFTVLVICAGGFYSIKPHDRPKTMQEKMDRKMS